MAASAGCRTYISEPARGRRRWTDKIEARDAVYANRRRIRGNRGQRLRKLRGEIAERSNAHCYETGGLRRVHVRQQANVEKRVLIQAATYNLALMMRALLGAGTPKGLTRRLAAALGHLFDLDRARRALQTCTRFICAVFDLLATIDHAQIRGVIIQRNRTLPTGC